MITKTVTITSPDGLHARPAGELVRTVKSFAGTTVTLATSMKKVNAAGMLSVLSLGLKAGTVVEVAADGPQEAEALDAVVGIIEKSN